MERERRRLVIPPNEREQVISLFLFASLSLSLASNKSTREESDPWLLLLLARLKP